MVGTLPAEEPNADAAREIRRVIYDVWEGWANGVPEQIDQHFSDDFVGVNANGREPTRWTVAVVGIKQIKELDENAINRAEKWRNNPSWQQAQEVLHIDVKNNHAIVVNEQWISQPDSSKQMTKEVMWQEVVLFRQINKQWKITNGFWGTEGEEKVWHWDPE